MSDEDALLAAISAHPDEDTPRLMYADWLDEHGRVIRAEFIRLQLTQPDNLPADEQKKLVDRQRFLLENHRRDILGPLGADLTIFNVAFRRGFATELNVTALLFLQRAPAIGELRPVPRVRIRNLNKTTLDRARQCPELNLVVELRVMDFGAPLATALAGAGNLARLEVLGFESNGSIGNDGLEALAFSDNVPALVDLNVSGNAISDVGVERLVASPLWRRLKRLDLSSNPLTDDGADHLCNAPDNAIERLTLCNTSFGSAARRRLARKFGDRVELY